MGYVMTPLTLRFGSLTKSTSKAHAETLHNLIVQPSPHQDMPRKFEDAHLVRLILHAMIRSRSPACD